MSTTAPDAPAVPLKQSAVRRLLEKFTVLRGAIRELWLVFAIKFVGIAAYQVTNMTLVLWLSSDLGFSDEKALALVAAWSLMMTIGTLLVGSLTDVLGLRRTFFLGAWVCLLARAVMVFVDQKWLALILGMFPLAIGEALGTPVLIAAVRRYSNTRQRSISFSLFYTMMNVGFLATAFLFDWVRQGLGELGHLKLPLVGCEISTYRTLFLVSLTLEFCLLPLLYFLREGAEATDAGLQITPPKPKANSGSLLGSLWLTVRDSTRSTVQLFSELFQQRGVYRLLAFLMLIAFLKLIFMQMYYVYPKFGVRELGNGAPIGKLWGINSLLIIFLVPLIGALTQRMQAYTTVIVGGAVSAASVFIMAMPTAWFVSLADGPFGQWLGHTCLGLTGTVHPYYVMITIYVVILSFGEALYSPRVYEYAAAIAPKGREASYGALSYVPFLLAKLLVGTFSGFLLARFCPETGPRHSATLWLIVAVTTLVAPLGLLILRPWIRVQEAGRD